MVAQGHNAYAIIETIQGLGSTDRYGRDERVRQLHYDNQKN